MTEDSLLVDIKSIQIGYVGARNGMCAALGIDPPVELVLDIIQLMAHHLLTQSGTLGLGPSLHNVDMFCHHLRAIVAESQKNVKATSGLSNVH